MTEKFKILAKYIKDMSSETPNIETYIFVRDYISKYQLNIDINSKALKNKMVEVNTILKFEDKQDNKKKSYFKLRALINYQLSELGLEKIYNINRDTYSNDNLFFSHRRASHKGRKTTGRLINLISLS